MPWNNLNANSKLSNANAMDSPPTIEEKLRQLAPASISEDGQAMLGQVIDQLAGVEPRQSQARGGENPAATIHSGMKHWPWKAAAALALLTVPTMMWLDQDDSAPSLTTTASTGDPLAASELVILKSTNRIDGRVEDGLIIPRDGSNPHYRYRYSVTDEEQVRDAQTGTIITLRQPRQEVVTIPVTQF